MMKSAAGGSVLCSHDANQCTLGSRVSGAAAGAVGPGGGGGGGGGGLGGLPASAKDGAVKSAANATAASLPRPRRPHEDCSTFICPPACPQRRGLTALSKSTTL